MSSLAAVSRPRAPRTERYSSLAGRIAPGLAILLLVVAGCGTKPPPLQTPPAESQTKREVGQPADVTETVQTPTTSPTREAHRTDTATPITSFAVYALSRGKGVPPEARLALQRVKALSEADRSRGLAVTIETRRIGIEGETRLCVEYRDKAAGTRAFHAALSMVKDVDLVNVVAEPCAPPSNNSLRKEKRP